MTPALKQQIIDLIECFYGVEPEHQIVAALRAEPVSEPEKMYADYARLLAENQELRSEIRAAPQSAPLTDRQLWDIASDWFDADAQYDGVIGYTTLDPDMVAALNPEDAHLQHGPISTELRQAAEVILDKSYIQDHLGNYGIAAVDEYLDRSDEFGLCWDTARNASALQKQIFLLILSESLADIGL